MTNNFEYKINTVGLSVVFCSVVKSRACLFASWVSGLEWGCLFHFFISKKLKQIQIQTRNSLTRSLGFQPSLFLKIGTHSSLSGWHLLLCGCLFKGGTYSRIYSTFGNFCTLRLRPVPTHIYDIPKPYPSKKWDDSIVLFDLIAQLFATKKLMEYYMQESVLASGHKLCVESMWKAKLLY